MANNSPSNKLSKDYIETINSIDLNCSYAKDAIELMVQAAYDCRFGVVEELSRTVEIKLNNIRNLSQYLIV